MIQSVSCRCRSPKSSCHHQGLGEGVTLFQTSVWSAWPAGDCPPLQGRWPGAADGAHFEVFTGASTAREKSDNRGARKRQAVRRCEHETGSVRLEGQCQEGGRRHRLAWVGHESDAREDASERTRSVEGENKQGGVVIRQCTTTPPRSPSA